MRYKSELANESTINYRRQIGERSRYRKSIFHTLFNRLVRLSRYLTNVPQVVYEAFERLYLPIFIRIATIFLIILWC